MKLLASNVELSNRLNYNIFKEIFANKSKIILLFWLQSKKKMRNFNYCSWLSKEMFINKPFPESCMQSTSFGGPVNQCFLNLTWNRIFPYCFSYFKRNRPWLNILRKKNIKKILKKKKLKDFEWRENKRHQVNFTWICNESYWSHRKYIFFFTISNRIFPSVWVSISCDNF